MDLEPLKIDRETRTRRPRRAGRFVGPVVTLAVIGGLLWWFRSPLLGLADRLRLPEVKVGRVVKRSPAAAAAGTGASANGYIVAKTRAALSADTPGRIVEMNVEEGSVVHEGDVVARLYYDEYQAALRRSEADVGLAETSRARAEAEEQVTLGVLAGARSSRDAAAADVTRTKASLDLASSTYDRIAKLVEQKVESAQRLDERKNDRDAAEAAFVAAQANLQVAEQAVLQSESRVLASRAAIDEAKARITVLAAVRDQSRATLDKTYVRAPFDGIVVLKDAEVGEVVSPNVQGGSNARGSVVTMVDFSSLEVQAEVPETSLAVVRIGAPTRIYLDAYPETPYPGSVSRIWPTANRTKATVEVRVEFERLDERLRPEMGVRVVFLDRESRAVEDAPGAGSEPVVLVPREAVVHVGGADGVFLLERDTVRFRPVVLGEESAGRLVAKEGLAGGEEIVLDPPATLEDGDRVQKSEDS